VFAVLIHGEADVASTGFQRFHENLLLIQRNGGVLRAVENPNRNVPKIADI